ncbi:MAG: hypothetical protein LUH22_01490 [Bacteroides sp.]|nr:hypothetical protein [Bacteroides sp.]
MINRSSDVFGRVCVTGLCANTNLNALATIPLSGVITVRRDNVTAAYKGYALSGITLTSPRLLSVNYYDDYNFLGKACTPEFNNTNITMWLRVVMYPLHQWFQNPADR